MNRNQQGFTLIELMIVVAIIAILAAIAIPLYLNYTARAQGSEALSLSSGLKTDVVEYYNEHGTFGTSVTANSSFGAAPSNEIKGKYVASVAIATDGTGTITATFCQTSATGCAINAKLAGHKLYLQPTAHGGSIEWACYVDTSTIYKLVPANCRYNSASSAFSGSN